MGAGQPLDYVGSADQRNLRGEAPEITYSGEAYDPARQQRLGLGKRAGRRQPAAGGCPKRKVATRRMSGDHSACEVKVHAGRLAAEEVDGLGDVIEGSGIAATRLVRAPIANAPGRDTVSGEVGAEVA